MVAIKRLQRVGNSTGIVLPPEILKVAGLGRSDEVLVHIEAGVITRFPRDSRRRFARVGARAAGGVVWW